MMYDELVKDLRENHDKYFARDMQAADAIKELQKCLDGVEADNDSLCATIDELERDLKRSKEYEAFWEKEANEALKKFQTTVASMPRWIPVTERLPENDGWYLVYAPDYRGGSSSGLKCVDGKMFCKFAKGKWSIEHGYYNRPGCVTHWMRLPEAPKEEGA